MGLSVARSLIKAGHAVRLFEQNVIPNSLGSSFDDHRLIRFPYGAHEHYMSMVFDAYKAWEGVWNDIKATHYQKTGTLVISKAHKGWARDSYNAIQKAGLHFESLTNEHLKRKCPSINTKDIAFSMYLPTGGVLFATRILKSLKTYLLSQSVKIHEHTPIRRVEHSEGSVFTSDGSRYSADLIVITAGPWLPDLIPEISDLVTPSMQSTFYFDIPDTARDFWSQMPMILDIDKDSGFYFVPPVSGLGLKAGDHRFSLEGHPDHRNSSNSDNVTRRLAINRLPLLKGFAMKKEQVCFYTVARNEEFIARNIDKTWILTGFSGHGFKFGPLIGEQMARVIADRISKDAFKKWIAGKGTSDPFRLNT